MRVARVMAMVTKRAMATDGNTMSTATKRVMATDGDNTGNSYGEEAGRQATAATMAMGMGTARRTWPLMLHCVMVAMGHGLCVFLYVWRDHKK